MVEFFKNWCEGIIVAVVISIIVESILPDGNNKKYVKVVIGIYIIFTILNPFLGKIDTEIKIPNELNLATVETASVDTENIRKLYANGIEETLKKNIEEEFECKVNHIEISYDETYENIEKINLKIQENGVSEIEKVEIGNQTQAKEIEQNYEEIKNYIAENYELEKDKIFMD